MTRRHRHYPTPYTLGRLQLVTFRHRRGYAIVDRASGAVEWTTPHPVSGRPIPAMEADPRHALRIAAEIVRLDP